MSKAGEEPAVFDFGGEKGVRLSLKKMPGGASLVFPKGSDEHARYVCQGLHDRVIAQDDLKEAVKAANPIFYLNPDRQNSGAEGKLTGKFRVYKHTPKGANSTL